MKAASAILKPATSLIQYFKDSWQELDKVTWPTRTQSVRLTAAVIVFSFVFAGISGIIDFGLAEVIESIIGESTTPPAPLPPANNLPGQNF